VCEIAWLGAVQEAGRLYVRNPKAATRGNVQAVLRCCSAADHSPSARWYASSKRLIDSLFPRNSGGCASIHTRLTGAAPLDDNAHAAAIHFDQTARGANAQVSWTCEHARTGVAPWVTTEPAGAAAIN
jgi:hypothetical protein